MKKIHLIFALFTVVIFSSCKKEKDKLTTPLTPDEASKKIEATAGQLKNDLQKLANSEGLKSISGIMNMIRVRKMFGNIDDLSEKLAQKTSDFTRKLTQIVPSNEGSRLIKGKFLFSKITGKFVWDNNEKRFKKVSESANLILLFPSDENAATNNAVLTITKFSVFQEKNRLFPKELVGDLKVSGKLQASVNLTASYAKDGMPLLANLNYFMNPFTLKIDGSNKLGEDTKLNAVFSLDKEVVSSNNIKVTFKDSSTKNLNSISKVESEQTLRNIKLKGSVDVASMEALKNDPNKLFNYELFVDNRKAGDILIKRESDETVPYIKYLDGTTKKLEEVMQPVADEIQKLIKKFKKQHTTITIK